MKNKTEAQIEQELDDLFAVWEEEINEEGIPPCL